MQLQEAVNNTFVQLAVTLQQLSHAEYKEPCKTLYGNTVGQHVRHIIELFQCLEQGYEGGVVNYEKRKRDPLIETDKEIAGKFFGNARGPESSSTTEASGSTLKRLARFLDAE